MPTSVEDEESESEVPRVAPEPSSSTFAEDGMDLNATEEGGEGECLEEKHTKQHRQRPRKQKLYVSIRKQMEFYFSDANITKQRMMKDIVLSSEYVNLQIFLEKFNKVSQLSKNIEDFRRALKHSDKLVLSEDELGVKRKIPFDESKVKSNEAVENCTIYVENIPPDVNHDWIEKIFQEFGPVAYISLPKFKRNRQPKGFAFVEFEEQEGAQRCLEAYGELGACLSSNIDPAGLLSVTTYNEEKKAEKDNGKSQKKTRKRSHGHIQPLEDEGAQVIEKKKMKAERKDEKVEKSEVKIEMDTEKPTVKATESKDVVAKDLAINSKLEASSNAEITSKKNLNEMKKEVLLPKVESESTGLDIVESGSKGNPLMQTEKKKKRRKKKNKGDDLNEEKLESDLIHLKILPKKHWRQLRNRYLNLQRENMSKLKAQLRTEENRRYLEPPTPGTCKSICVKINLSSPPQSVETFKSQIMNELVPLDWSNLVKHVDYEEGKLDAIIRLDGSHQGREGLDMFVQNAGRVFKNVVTMTSK